MSDQPLKDLDALRTERVARLAVALRVCDERDTRDAADRIEDIEEKRRVGTPMRAVVLSLLTLLPGRYDTERRLGQHESASRYLAALDAAGLLWVVLP